MRSLLHSWLFLFRPSDGIHKPVKLFFFPEVTTSEREMSIAIIIVMSTSSFRHHVWLFRHCWLKILLQLTLLFVATIADGRVAKLGTRLLAVIFEIKCQLWFVML